MSTEDRLAALEARLQAAEDHLAILNLLNSYGPLVDSCTAKEAGELWIEGGGYNFGINDGATKRLVAPDEVAGMYSWPGHVDLTKTGCSHLTATPKITIDGDTAQAVGYSFVVLREGDRWFLWRAAINHWTLRRTGENGNGGWRIDERTNRTLDGSDQSHETMRKVLAI